MIDPVTISSLRKGYDVQVTTNALCYIQAINQKSAIAFS